MKRKIYEGVAEGDLQSLVKNVVSIGEYEPKTGTNNEVMVIGFYVVDEAPANDLAVFIERGTSGALDTEVSPNPDDEGYYMVFVEVDNDTDAMTKTFEIICDASRLTNLEEWTLQFYSGKEITLKEKDINAWLKSNR